MTSTLLRAGAHLVFRGREFHYRQLRAIAAPLRHCSILEIGSGKPSGAGVHQYSAKSLFDPSNRFIQSDVVASYGHQVVDVTAMEFAAEFDVVLCLNVMEHVFDFHRAFANVHRAVKPGGLAVIGVPGYYPLHDEPHDYWRYTEHALRRLLAPYRSVELTHSGPRRYPFAYFAKATK